MPPASRLPALMDALVQSGGIATGADLVAVSSPATLRAALKQGYLARLGRGTYARADIATSADASAAARSWARWTEPLTEDELRVLIGRHARAVAAGAALYGLSAAHPPGWALLREPQPAVTRVVARVSETRDERRLGRSMGASCVGGMERLTWARSRARGP